jgi:hypothetical protein
VSCCVAVSCCARSSAQENNAVYCVVVSLVVVTLMNPRYNTIVAMDLSSLYRTGTLVYLYSFETRKVSQYCRSPRHFRGCLIDV